LTSNLAFLGFVLLLSGSLAGCALGAAALRRGRHRAAAPDGFAPAVSILKPLAGLDADLEENLESFFRLDYPRDRFEVVFSFAYRDDPAFRVACRAADRHPEVRSTFVVDARETGRNSKVSRLEAALRVARHANVLFSDGDVRVPPDFLANAVSWLSDPAVGLVSHLFRSEGADSPGARVESLYLDGILRPATAGIARVLGRPCVVGKSILVSRAALNAIGGIAPLRNHLAEDFLLGTLVRRAGYRVVLSSDEVSCRIGSRSLRGAWLRHRRWAILRRRLAGFSYASEALASPTVLLAGALLTSGGSAAGATLAILLWSVRLGLELASAPRAARRPVTDLFLLPVRDLFAAAVFAAGLVGQTSTWRGRRLRVGPGTLLLPADARGRTVPAALGRRSRVAA
jgi:ceramide glucosyltransferase